MRRSRLAWVIALALVLVAVVALVRRGNGNTLDVITARVVERAVFRSTVTASGEIVATRYADVGSSAMGRIVSLRVKEGDRVRAGEVVAVIDPVQAEAESAAARANLQSLNEEIRGAERAAGAARADVVAAEARAREAEQTLARVRDLAAQALVSRAELDAAQASFETTAAQVAAARAAAARVAQGVEAARARARQANAQAARARDVLAKTRIESPIDGTVTSLGVREGEMVVIGIQNQPGTTLMTISDLADIDAEVKVAEADVLRLAVGQPANVVLEAIPGRTFPGKVVEIGASALQTPAQGAAVAAREFRVVVRLDTADTALRTGLTCDAEILTEERRNVLTVPLQAVVLRPADAPATGAGDASSAPREQAGVFLVDDDRARFQKVDTGIIGGLDIEVRGVERGVEVVSGPYQALRDLQDGSQIRKN